MMIGIIVLIVWLIIRFGLDKIGFSGWWVLWAYLIEIGIYLLIMIIFGIISAICD